MALTQNNFGGVDLLATVTELDKRVTALEGKHLVVSEEQPAEPDPAAEKPKQE